MKSHYPKVLVVAGALALAACGSAPTRVSTGQMRTTMGLDPQDVAEVAAQMTESLISSGAMREKGKEGRSIVAISTFRNNTALYDFDPKLVYNKVMVALNKSGLAYGYVTGDAYVDQNRSRVASSNAEAVAHARAKNELLELTGSAQRETARVASSGPRPQYTLTLELIENHGSVGRTTQKGYQVHMTLNAIGQGLALWEDEQPINKMGTRAAVGF